MGKINLQLKERQRSIMAADWNNEDAERQNRWKQTDGETSTKLKNLR